MMMKRKKQRSSAEVTWELSGMWLGKLLKEGQMAEIITARHWPPWKDCVPAWNQYSPITKNE